MLDYDTHYDISQKWSNKFLHYANNIALYSINIILGTELKIKGKPSTPFSAIEAHFVSLNHIIKQGYWCMPCCILETNVHSKMPVCSSMSSQPVLCKQYDMHGRCGIDFDPWKLQQLLMK